MRLTRCFVELPLSSGATLALPAAPSAHVARVLRLRAGAMLTLFDGHGGEFQAEIRSVSAETVSVQVGAHAALEREAPIAVTLLQCLARGERMDWIVQKATELGVTEIVPVHSEHSVVRLDPATAARRRAHWQAVTIGACEQSGRNRVPRVLPVQAFAEACTAARAAACRLLLAPEAERSLAAAALAGPTGAKPAFALLAGPEGGLSTAESLLALGAGWSACRLGPRVLRTETAPLAALATLQALAGDFAPGADWRGPAHS
jgi:16S rRNA (uracil1498-N3)-methyltransferase